MTPVPTRHRQNVIEDKQIATSQMVADWTPDDKFIWHLEVREYLAGADRRLGKLTLRGSWDGSLLCCIDDTSGWMGVE